MGKKMGTEVFVLTRDGKEVARGTEFECVRYIHRNHCYSFEHALLYEGYAMKEVSS